MSETAALERLLTAEEAGAYLGTAPRFMRRLVSERRIRFVRVGKYIRFPESALAEYVADGTVKATARRLGY